MDFEKLRYTVKVSAEGKAAGPLDKLKGSTLDKDLLHDVSGSVNPGSVLAILGPSGAGKTTLLNMLTLEKKGGVPQGHIRVDGAPFTLDKYNETAASVEQSDTLWASLTVKDHLVHAVRLYQPQLNAAARDTAVQDLIKSVGLEDQQHVKAGNEFMRGLSGGNKRRLSIAVALAKRPSVLFLDEPTSGVDSASAVMIMSFLKEIAEARSIIIVCTIHQPPASVFAGFDNCMLLSMGRVAYFGKADSMGEYFASIGNPPPADTNIAEFVLDLVNTDFTPEEGVHTLLDKWSERDGKPYTGPTPASSEPAPAPKPRQGDVLARAGFCTQLGVLVLRDLAVARREPLAYLLRMGVNFFCAFFFGIIYLETRHRAQDQVQSRTFFIMFSLGIPMQLILVAVYQYYQQWVALKKEVKDGMYHPVAAAVASWVVQAPMQFVLAACSMVPIFVIGDMHWPNFPMAWLIYAITFWAFEGMAQVLMLSVSPRVLFGLFNYLNLFFASFLFCGMFVDPDDVIWPLRLFCYFLPLRWSLQSYIFSIYHGQRDYDGAFFCTPGKLMPNDYGPPIICGQQGFYCSSPSDPTGAVCYGRTGDQILNSLSLQFTIFGDEGHYARNLGIVIAFGTLCRLLYVVQIVLLTKVVGSEEPRPPTTAPSAGRNGAAVAVAPARKPPASVAAAAPDAAAAEAQEGAPAAAMGRASAHASGTAFAFSNIGYEITPKNALGAAKGAPKSVLAGTSATVTEGEVLAIVGPSGAGKTVLLDTLNFSKGAGSPTGAISLNGRPLTRAMHTRACIYVPREDILWPSLTPRQHLRFAFRLYQPALDAGAREAAIDDLLSATGMTSAQHTKAGGLLFQGLSGGQRRRLSLCIALAKQPRVLLLDEPTSGLDSAAAAAIITLLKSIAAKCSAAIVCTIHQPSAAVFAGFNQVLVLSEGRVAYCGTRDDMAPHFASIGKPLRIRDGDGASGAVAVEANPAEAVLDLVSKDISSKEAVADVLDAWEASAKGAPKPPPTGMAAPVLEPRAIGACGQTLVVLRRQLFLAVNDPLQYLARFVVCPFVCAFFGLIYVASREHTQKQVPFRLFYLWWILCIPPCLCIISIIGMSVEMRSVINEIRNGMYRPLSYALSTAVVQAPMLLALSFAINVLVFAVGGWPWDNFVTFVLQYACNLFVFESLAQLLIVALPNPILGMLAFLMYWTTSIVFCGLVFRGGDVIWPFRLLYYVMPLRWLFNGLGYDLYTPSTYGGAFECVPGDDVTTDQGTATCAATGFYCTDASQSLGCYGRTGSQVLDTLHFAYESLDSADDRVMNVLIMLGMALVLKVAFVLVLWRTVEQSDSPKQQTTKATAANAAQEES